MLERAVEYEAELEDMCARGVVSPNNAARRVHRVACEHVLAILRQSRPLAPRDFDAIHVEMMGIFEQDFCDGSSLELTVLFTEDVLRAAVGERGFSPRLGGGCAGQGVRRRLRPGCALQPQLPPPRCRPPRRNAQKTVASKRYMAT